MSRGLNLEGLLILIRLSSLECSPTRDPLIDNIHNTHVVLLSDRKSAAPYRNAKSHVPDKSYHLLENIETLLMSLGQMSEQAS